MSVVTYKVNILCTHTIQTEAGLRQKESSSGDLQHHIADLQHQLQAEVQRVEEARAHLRETEASLEKHRRQAEVMATKVRTLEEALGKVKDNVGRLEEERADLLAKIEAGEGVNTAINQLKQENVSSHPVLSRIRK